jgi:hypothetical protein
MNEIELQVLLMHTRQSVCCLLVLNSVTSTAQWMRYYDAHAMLQSVLATQAHLGHYTNPMLFTVTTGTQLLNY